MALTVKRAKGTYGFQRVAYRHIDGTTMAAEIVSTSALGTPTGLAIVPTGTTGATTYGYRVTALGGGGESLAQTEVQNATGNATLSGVNYNALSVTPVTGASGYVWYRTTGGATQGKIGTSTTTTFNDTGLAAAGAVPGSNTAVSFNIRVPSLKPAGASASVKTGIPFLNSRTATGGIVVGR
jgi:hypothetical protein